MLFRKRVPANGKAQHTYTTKKTNSEREQTNLKNKWEDLALPRCCYVKFSFEQINQDHLDEGKVMRECSMCLKPVRKELGPSGTLFIFLHS